MVENYYESYLSFNPISISYVSHSAMGSNVAD